LRTELGLAQRLIAEESSELKGVQNRFATEARSMRYHNSNETFAVNNLKDRLANQEQEVDGLKQAIKDAATREAALSAQLQQDRDAAAWREALLKAQLKESERQRRSELGRDLKAKLETMLTRLVTAGEEMGISVQNLAVANQKYERLKHKMAAILAAIEADDKEATFDKLIEEIGGNKQDHAEDDVIVVEDD